MESRYTLQLNEAPWTSLRRCVREFFGFQHDGSYLLPRWMFLRLLGIVMLLAFYGWFDQGEALIGSQGIQPVSGFLTQRLAKLGAFEAVIRVPSVFWLDSSSAAITAVSFLGMACGVALILNLVPRAALVVGWILYVSIISVCGYFAPAQVDGLLIEVMFLAIFFAPRGFRPGLGASAPPHRFAVFSMRWFVFRVMFQSGLIKILEPDTKWLDFTIMEAVYQTAPLPTLLGYYAFNLPHWWHVGEVFLTGVAELLAPLLALLGSRPRFVAIIVWVLFQLGIEVTANYGWLNFMAIAAGLLLLDDRMIQSLLVRVRATAAAASLTRLLESAGRAAASAPSLKRLAVFYGALSLHLYLTCIAFAVDVFELPKSEFSGMLYSPYWWTTSFRTANAYTLYGSTESARIHTEFMGSDDQGATWRTYKLRYQPHELNRSGPFIAPYFARFDATLEILGHKQQPNPILLEIGKALLLGNEKVLALFRENPFPGHPPGAIRFPRYRYSYTSLQEKKASGNYWKREYLGDFMKALVHDAHSGVFKLEE